MCVNIASFHSIPYNLVHTTLYNCCIILRLPSGFDNPRTALGVHRGEAEVNITFKVVFTRCHHVISTRYVVYTRCHHVIVTRYVVYTRCHHIISTRYVVYTRCLHVISTFYVVFTKCHHVISTCYSVFGK